MVATIDVSLDDLREHVDRHPADREGCGKDPSSERKSDNRGYGDRDRGSVLVELPEERTKAAG
jgi:hypothetical protein